MIRTIRCIVAAWLAAPLLAFAQAPSYEGLWWNSPANSESGWGLNVTHQGNILFATWFTYDRQGVGMWLVMPELNLQPGYYDPYYMTYSEGTEYAGTVYRTTGPSYDSANFSTAGAITATVAGTAGITFLNADTASFAYTVDGVMRTKTITRQVFGPMPACTLGGSAGASPNYQGLWWRSPAGSESGWGVNLTHQGDIVFATWFTYDSSRRGMWVVMPEGRRTGTTNAFTGAIYRTTGPSYDSTTWNASSVQATQLGTATFTFSDSGNGTFAYTVNGVSASKPITRQVFSSPATVCR
jgi:hypothetical protein